MIKHPPEYTGMVPGFIPKEQCILLTPEKDSRYG